ncbi:MAG: hypothetical protein ACYC8T_14995 [Myxococcaceae bacterium]
MLGLGDLVLRDKERPQPRAGRLDLLLQDPETDRRYEVEIQLGASDESHIIRTIEYWDIERKRYPQYDHCAVIVAEDITSRFLNVIGLFNGSIPIIAIQMRAMKIGDKVALMFTTVLDELTRGLVDDDEEVAEPADREYWETRGSPSTVTIADDLAKGGQGTTFAIMRAKKAYLNLEPRLARSEEIDGILSGAGLEVLAYDKRNGRYKIRLDKAAVVKHGEVHTEILRRAYQRSGA